VMFMLFGQREGGSGTCLYRDHLFRRKNHAETIVIVVRCGPGPGGDWGRFGSG
jgi:hypothetical protein